MEQNTIENLENIIKGTELRVNNGLGYCKAFALESIKQGRGLKKTIIVDLRGSEIGLFDDFGSIYVKDILEVVSGGI